MTMEFVQDLLYVLITAAVPVLTTYICKFLYTKWTEGKANIKNEQVSVILDQVVSMVLNCVQKTNQTFVDELKKHGKFTKEAAMEAFNMTKETALMMLSEDARRVIAKVYGDVDIYLNTLIEAKVKEMKY